MNNNIQSIKAFAQKLDWKLLLLLVLFLNVKLVVKIVAIVIIYILRPNFKFGVSWKNNRLPIFYLLAIALAIINAVAYQSFSSFPKTFVIGAGVGFWLICFLAMHQLALSVEKNETYTLHNTLTVFFSLNILCSVINILAIVFETGEINPYTYQGNYQQYFIGTGDYIKGISFDTSTTNAVINAFAVVYFLAREKALLTIVSIGALLLAASNFTNVVLLVALVVMFFNGSAIKKSLVVCCSAMVVIFFTKISPHNSSYVKDGINRFVGQQSLPGQLASVIPTTPSDFISPEEKKEKIAHAYLDSLDQVEAMKTAIAVADTARTRPVIPTPSIHSEPFQRKKDTSTFQKELLVVAKENDIPLLPAQETASKSRPGKLLAAMETFQFLKSHPVKIISGNGTGNFSSKLAFRSTALNVAGGYPEKYKYINDDFKRNHLALFLSYYTNDRQNHSIINTPNSTYDQLISEYGLLGFAAFLLFYVGFFSKHFKKLTYGIPVLLIMGAMFFVEYWFEQLSVVILFELLLFLDLKERRQLLTGTNE